MTEYELADVATSLIAEAGRSTTDFVTVLFGYLIFVHIVGAKLEQVYVVIVTMIYSLFVIWPILGAFQAGRMLYNLTLANPEASKTLGLVMDFSPSFVPFMVLVPAWALSLAYMYHVRKHANSA